uniref:Ribosomal protein S2 n=1 Tax=Panagrolaimus superbus TaxID=310955 RepID=A0A914YIJ7_9BILA
MYYIAKNPKNAEVYQKMIKICKYFFVKNPILVISNLHYYQNGWGTRKNDGWNSIDMNRISAKLWITDRLPVYRQHVSNNSLVSSIIPKIYQCDAKYLILCDQVISLNELIFLCSSAEALDFKRVTVKNGTVLAFEKFFEQLPQIKVIYYTFSTPSNNTTKNTFKDTWKISHLSNSFHFYLFNIPQNFDIDIFYSYMKYCLFFGFNNDSHILSRHIKYFLEKQKC